jgi:superfamily II DNA helicase RecQ
MEHSPLSATDSSVDKTFVATSELFTFSPFGLGCRLCKNNVTIQMEERSIQLHLKKHGMDSRVSSIRSLLKGYKTLLQNAKALQTIDSFRRDFNEYIGYSCVCGLSFLKKGNAFRHCKKLGCDQGKLQNIELIQLCCGRYVSHAQVTSFFNSAPRITEQFDYRMARATLLPFLPQKEKHDHTYTHMFTPLIIGCGCDKHFVEKIKTDFISIHPPPSLPEELLLTKIHKQAEVWLLNFAQKNVLMVPGTLRAGLQTFEGGEVDNVSQRCTYTMQHDPRSLLPELKKLLSFSYRRGLFATRGFDTQDGFAIPYFLKDLLLEVPSSVASHPFVVEFCLMFAFRVPKDGAAIYMISCDTMSSLFSKIASILKAAVCSVICSFSEQAFTTYGNLLVKSVREAPVLHILSPMIRQIREMHGRLPKRQKTILDPGGNIIVDQYAFPFDVWSQIVPLTVSLLRKALTHLANGSWWEPVVDPSTIIKVQVDKTTSDIFLLGVASDWNVVPFLLLDQLDYFTALLQMAFHGFGGGSARMRELSDTTMFHCIYSNDTLYYSMTSLKGFNSSSRCQFKKVERKLPPVITRYFLLFRSLINKNTHLFDESDSPLIFPRRRTPSQLGIPNAIQHIFNLDSSPDMRQVRQFWACVSNFLTGDDQDGHSYLTSKASSMAASKMGHSKMTHSMAYSSKRVGGEESHFNAYHFAIGDTSYNMSKLQSSTLSLGDIRMAMSLRHANTAELNGHNYLSPQQKELVEFGHGQIDTTAQKQQHCFGLLAPGEGKSEVYIIPTIARQIGNQRSKMIIHVSPYNFLSAYQFSNAITVLDKLGFWTPYSTRIFTGRDINVGLLPDELSNKDDLPSLLFLNLDALFNLFMFHAKTFKSWINVMDKIVIDEAHTFLAELPFREKYQVYWRLPVLGIPIVALSGSLPLFVLPRFAMRLCLTVDKHMADIKIIHGSDIFGKFPKGFQIKYSITPRYVHQVASFAIRCVRDGGGAVHVFVVDKRDGELLQQLISNKSVNCMFVSSDTPKEDLKTVAFKWGNGEFDILISTSIALVGNENPLCQFVACAGYLFDAMQVVQGFGRLRPYMRTSAGQILFSAPEVLQKHRTRDDEQRFTRLLNENLLSQKDHALFKATMTSGGVRNWTMDAASGNKGCALKILSLSFGKEMKNCGACPFCRSIPTINLQTEAASRRETERKNEQATERVLQRLVLCCLACKKADCRGIPILKGKGSKNLPENQACCFSWRNCYKCGVSQHDRSLCFDKSYLNNIACCECWVYKHVSGSRHHETSDCDVKGRLRRLLSHHYTRSQVKGSFKDYIEVIYTSSATFCQFMSSLEAEYIQK